MSEETVSPPASVPSPQEENPQASNPTPQASSPASIPDAPKLEASATLKTRGVRPPRGNVSQLLHGAAKKAAHSNSRSDVHEYMRIRRGYV